MKKFLVATAALVASLAVFAAPASAATHHVVIHNTNVQNTTSTSGNVSNTNSTSTSVVISHGSCSYTTTVNGVTTTHSC